MFCTLKEPPLGDILKDPIITQLMWRDGVERSDLLDLLDAARLRLGPPPGKAAAPPSASSGLTW